MNTQKSVFILHYELIFFEFTIKTIFQFMLTVFILVLDV